MKKALIIELFERFENACYLYKDLECWSARDLQEILGYTKWDNFLNVIEKAKKACENAGGTVFDHFADIGKMIDLAKGAQREIMDMALTRYVPHWRKRSAGTLVSCKPPGLYPVYTGSRKHLISPSPAIV